MVSILGGCGALVALLMATIRLGISHINYLINGLSFNQLSRSALRPCTEADAIADKKHKKRAASPPAEKPKTKKPITFQTAKMGPQLIPVLTGYKVLQIFIGCAISSAVMLTGCLILSFFDSPEHVISYLPAALLPFLAFTFLGVIISFGDVSKKVHNVVFPLGFATVVFGILRVFPSGPCDLAFVFSSDFVTRIVAVTAAAYVGSALSLSILRLAEVRHELQNPWDGLSRSPTYKGFAVKMLGRRKVLISILYSWNPTNIFLFIATRFFIRRVPDLVLDCLFICTELVAAIIRASLARDCVQLLILTKSLRGLLKLDDKRTTAALKDAVNVNQQAIESICPNFLALLLPSCIAVVMGLLFALGLVVGGATGIYLRVISMFMLVLSDLFLGAQQFALAFR
jgi:hypothetical protein